jgi:hypothetical protein
MSPSAIRILLKAVSQGLLLRAVTENGQKAASFRPMFVTHFRSKSAKKKIRRFYFAREIFRLSARRGRH